MSAPFGPRHIVSGASPIPDTMNEWGTEHLGQLGPDEASAYLAWIKTEMVATVIVAGHGGVSVPSREAARLTLLYTDVCARLAQLHGAQPARRAAS